MIYAAKNANPILLDYLKGADQVFLTGPFPYGDERLACHADLAYCRLGAGKRATVFKGDPALIGSRYPEDCRYNAVLAGRYFIHNLKISDPSLLAAAEDAVNEQLGCRMTRVHVAQGYTKCNMAIIDEGHVITSDRGIAKALAGLDDMECLLISPGNVLLPGFDTGFIGGCSGRIGDEFVFNGDLTAHPDWERMTLFIEKCGLTVRYFTGYPLTDIGSIISD